MEFVIRSEQIVYICTLITLVWAVYKIIREVRKPGDDVKKRLDQHDQFLDADNKRLKEIEESNHMVLQCLLVLINHNITGNGVEKMKEARDQLQEFLINR